MPANCQGPFWAVELILPGKIPEFLGGEAEGLDCVLLSNSERLAEENASENGHGTRKVVPLLSLSQIGGAFLQRSPWRRGLLHVAFDNGADDVTVFPIPFVLKSLGF